ncbi:MAG: hypothetical protein ACFFDN_08025 [Candidatus Hodarchaeota archaeon]
MSRKISHRKNKKQLFVIGVIGLVIILFLSISNLQPANYLNFIPNIERPTQTPIFSSAIKNITDANLTVLYPVGMIQYYTNLSNGFGTGIVEDLKNETKVVLTAEIYPSTDYGNVYIEVSFDTKGLDISSMTLFRINWQGGVVSTASSVIDTKLNVYIDNQGAWELLHNATNTGGNMIDHKIGYWEHEISSKFQDYIINNTIKLKFEAEQTLTVIENNWFLYSLLYWANIVFGKDIEFVKLNATSVDLVYNDTNYEQIGSIANLGEDEDENTLAIKLNDVSAAGRNNLTFDIIFDLLNYSLDDIYGFKFYHDDWFSNLLGYNPPGLGTISIQNTMSNQFLPIQNLRIAPISYASLYPKRGFAAYTVSGKNWWNQSGLRLRYYQNITGLTNWTKIEIDLGYIEIARRISPIFSVSVENTTRYIDEIEYVQIFVQNYRSNVTDIRVFSSEGEFFINDAQGNYTFEITRATSGWYNFSVQIIDNEEHLVTKGRYNIWFNGRPISIDITLNPVPEEIQCTLIFTDTIYGAPVPNKDFDLWIYKYGDTIPYASYPGLTTNGSGMYFNSYSVSDYLDESYTFNVTTYADASYSRCSITSSATCSYAPPTFTISDVTYNSQYSGGTVTIYYVLDDWTVNIISAYLKENGDFLTGISMASGSNQVSFDTISGNNNYTFWAVNDRGQVGESEIVNLNLFLKPVKMDILTFYIDDFFYFFIDVKDNETGSSVDGVPVRISVYDGGFLLFSGNVETHSVIVGGFPFDQGVDHHFLFRAEIEAKNFVNSKKETQLPFQAYPLWDLLIFGLIIPAFIGISIFPRLLGKKKRSRRNRRYRRNENNGV